MSVRFCTKNISMAVSKKKKTILYGGFVVLLIYAFVHVTYFNEDYSPLQVLSDARSEARRLLRFLTLYHYQCNTTIQGFNISNWPVCLEKVGGLNLVLGGSRVMYSVGATDFSLERLLANNYSYSVHLIHHLSLTPEFLSSMKNKTKYLKTKIVPNDPSDYGRNSFDTQTLNSVFETLKHPVVDILKIEIVPDSSDSHELINFMVKDQLLTTVRQLHLALYVDNVDDDHLYSWYRALYSLFHTAGFRLYHTAASDTMCLQMTLMESCIYYMSWIRDPGPETFILYPPAIDGSDNFEKDRLEDYMSDTEATCHQDIVVHLPSAPGLTLCLDAVNRAPDKPCQLVIIRSSSTDGSITAVPMTKCSVVTLEVDIPVYGQPSFNVKQRRYERSTKSSVTLEAALQKYVTYSTVNILYIDLNEAFWKMLSLVLDSGALFNIDQFIININKVWGEKQSLDIRKKYSELKRIEAYGFRKYQINEKSTDNRLSFHGKLDISSQGDSCKINYLKSGSGRMS